MRPVTSCPAGITVWPDSPATGASRVARKLSPGWLREESIALMSRTVRVVPEGMVTGLGGVSGAAALAGTAGMAAVGGATAGFVGAGGTDATELAGAGEAVRAGAGLDGDGGALA